MSSKFDNAALKQLKPRVGGLNHVSQGDSTRTYPPSATTQGSSVRYRPRRLRIGQLRLEGGVCYQFREIPDGTVKELHGD